MLPIGNNTHIEGFANNYLPSVGRKTLGIIAAITFVAIAILFFVRRCKATTPAAGPLNLKKSLASWAQNCDEHEKPNRLEAAKRILNALEHDLSKLNLSSLNLTELPPEIGLLTQLTELNLGDNQLTSLPQALGNLNQLTNLQVYNNQLTSLPATLGNLTQLRRLDLINNQLTSLPETFGNLTQLRSLDLGHNLLTELPNTFHNLSRLTDLYINHNRLTSLPIALGNILGLTYIDCNGNPNLRSDQVSAIVRLSRARRAQESRSSLSALLEAWKTYSQQSGTYTFSADQFNENEQTSINEWLIRLSRAADFRNHQPQLAKVVCDLLEGLKDPDFKTLFFASVEGNQERCADRAAMGLNELFTAYKIHFLPQDAPLQDKLRLLVSGAKTGALRREIGKRIGMWEKEHGKFKESVETYLYYEVALKERLGLLTAISTTLYADGMGRRDWINTEELVESVETTYIKDLLSNPSAKTLIETDPSFKKEWTTRSAPFHEKLEALTESTLDEGTQLRESNAIMARLNAAMEEFTEEWIKKKLATPSS